MSAERIEKGFAVTAMAIREGNAEQLAMCINLFRKLGANGEQFLRALGECPVSLLAKAGFDLIVQLSDGSVAPLSELLAAAIKSEEVSCEQLHNAGQPDGEGAHQPVSPHGKDTASAACASAQLPFHG